MRRTLLGFLAVTCLVPVVIGCGDGRPERVPVAGQVLLNDKPLPSGFIRVVPEGHRPATGELDDQGRFVLTTYPDNPGDGCVVGTHPVEVSAWDDVRSLIPARYGSVETSELTVTINGATDSLPPIQLSSEGMSAEESTIITQGDIDPSL